MGCGNLLSGPNSNHRFKTTVYRPSKTLEPLQYNPEDRKKIRKKQKIGDDLGLLGSFTCLSFFTCFLNAWVFYSVAGRHGHNVSRPAKQSVFATFAIRFRDIHGVTQYRCRDPQRLRSTSFGLGTLGSTYL